MVPELGTFAIILALIFALTQGIAPLFGHYQKNVLYFHLSQTAVTGQFVFLAFAMICLMISLLTNDMSVAYVESHSHTLLPLIYRLGAAWGGHEGSLLLWCLILSGWTVVFIPLQRLLPVAPLSFQRGVIAVLGWLSAGFILFLFTTSNPFARVYPTSPTTGADLTPVLQDPGLLFHPPMLYLGYVGFAIGFAFAICALITGRFDPSVARACRPWIIMPWALLSCGIVLGSWWAYRELGWGGWWFWDPVENASLLPWLSATALLHALLVNEKRHAFYRWTLLLAIITFALSLLGTFLVRSGILVSVHAFASDPTRGLFLLAYLFFIIGGAFVLFGARILKISSPDTQPLPITAQKRHLFSRETLMLVNSVILMTCVMTILLGTLYPIILESLDLGKISVGEPYFTQVFLPMTLPLLLLMGFAPHSHWRMQSLMALWRKIGLTFLLSVMVGVFAPWYFGYPLYWLTACGITLSVWIILATGQHLLRTGKHAWLPQSAMVVSHLGIAILALGITINKSYSEERQLKIAPNETITFASYHITLQQLQEATNANFKSMVATFAIQQNQQTTPLVAEFRLYTSQNQTLSKPGILSNVFRDLYLALGNPLQDDSWSIRLYFKPFVRWIWAGGFLLLAGGILSLLAAIQARGKK